MCILYAEQYAHVTYGYLFMQNNMGTKIERERENGICSNCVPTWHEVLCFNNVNTKAIEEHVMHHPAGSLPAEQMHPLEASSINENFICTDMQLNGVIKSHPCVNKNDNYN